MSRYHRPVTGPTRDMLPLDQQRPETNLVPVTAEDAARAKRNKVLIWIGVVVGVAAVVLLVQQLSSRPVEARNYLADAQRFYDAGKYMEALTSVDLAVKQSRDRGDAHRLRLAIYRSLDRQADAYEEVTRLIKLEPQAAEHYRTRAQLALEMDSIQSAINDYTTLIDRYHDPAAYTGRALCYRKLGQPGKLIADLSKSIELKPTVENHLQRGLAYESMGDHQKAIADYNRAIAMDPNSGAAYRARGYSRGAIGDTAGAKQDAATALKLETPQPMP